MTIFLRHWQIFLTRTRTVRRKINLRACAPASLNSMTIMGAHVRIFFAFPATVSGSQPTSDIQRRGVVRLTSNETPSRRPRTHQNASYASSRLLGRSVGPNSPRPSPT